MSVELEVVELLAAKLPVAAARATKAPLDHIMDNTRLDKESVGLS